MTVRQEVRSRTAVEATIAITVAVLLTGCTPPAPSLDPPTNGSEPAVSPPNTSVPEDPATAGSSDVLVNIIVGDTILSATVWDNSATRSLLDQLPLTLQFSDYRGREMIAAPSEPLSMDGMPEADAPLAGELSYYAPSGSISLAYEDLGRWDGAARLGRVDGDLSVIRDQTEPVTVTLDRAP